MEKLRGNRKLEDGHRKPLPATNRKLGSGQIEPVVDEQTRVSSLSMKESKLNKLKLRIKEKLKVADRSESKERTGDSRPGKILRSGESLLKKADTEKSLVLYQPPAAKSSPETGGDDYMLPPVINLSNSLPGWSAKAKRRQSSQSKSSTEVKETEPLKTQKAKIEDYNQESESRKRRFETLQIEPFTGNHSNSDSSCSSQSKNLNTVDGREGKSIGSSKTGKRSYYRETDDPNKYHKSVTKSEDITVTKTFQINSKSEIVTIKHKMRKKMNIGGDSEASTSDSHKCGICGKSFASHQALGGHMSRHNKLIKSNPKTDPTTGEEGQGGSSSGVGGGSKLLEDDNAHQCKICKKNFPTGQALGGHQRCHWTGPGEVHSQTAAAQSSAGGRKVLDLDLNLAPPKGDDDDDVDGDSADGFASSSHNSTD